MSVWSQLDFTRPWLSVLALLPLAYYILNQYLGRKKPAVSYSDLSRIEIYHTWRTRSIFLPSLLALLAWLAFCVAMMGPRLGHEETQVTTEGIAIGMVMDVSGSMAQTDMPFDNTVISRYETVEKVFKEFIIGNPEKELEGRKNDMVSLIIFGKYVDDLCPLTLDHSFLLDLMHDNITSISTDYKKFNEYQQRFGPRKTQQMVDRKNPIWGGTAIYEGVALGADVLNKSDEAIADSQKKGEGNYRIKSKILIVLSDGQDTASQITSEEAAKVAKEFGIKVYTISIHGKPTSSDVFGAFIRMRGQEYDDGPMKYIAKETGGKFYQATDPESLTKIYQNIETLEKSKMSKQMTMEYSPVHRPWIMAGLILYGLYLLLANTLYRELP